MKPRPGLNEIYNMLDQDESQRIVGYSRPVVSTPSPFQAQAILTEQNNILMAQGNSQKPKCLIAFVLVILWTNVTKYMVILLVIQGLRRIIMWAVQT